MSELIFTRDEWPYGLRCMECDAQMEEGAAYSKRLIGLSEDVTPISEIICIPCALGLAVTA